MQFKSLITILAITGTTLAQDFSSVPKCAITPALAAFGKTGCALSNVKCICSATSLVADLENAIKAVCSASDVAKANAFAVSTCKAAGVNLVIPGYTASAGAAATGTAGTSTGSAGSATTTSSGSTASSTATNSTASVTSSSNSTAASTTGAGQSSSTASASPSHGAANALQVGGPALVGVFLAALAL